MQHPLTNLRMPLRWCVFAFEVALLSSGLIVVGQDKADVEAGQVPAQAQKDYRFEVTSIKPTSGPISFQPGHAPGPAYTPGRYREESAYLAVFVYGAFNLKHAYQTEYPKWMNETFFTVEATLPEGATKADLPVMLRHMLEDRFALKSHHETRHIAGYELVVVKTSPGITKAAPPDPQTLPHNGSSMEIGKDGVPHLNNKKGIAELWSGQNQNMQVEMRVRNQTMEQVSAWFADRVKAPVKDGTGLAGGYDFTLLYSPELPLAAGGSQAPEPMDHPLLRDALQEQLGLKLQPVKDVLVDVLVVDSANKVPTDN